MTVTIADILYNKNMNAQKTMKILTIWMVLLISLVKSVNSAVPNYKGCEFYLDKMTQLYGKHFPRSNAAFRDPGANGVEGFFKFLRQPGDLVIIMDRSEGFSAHFFYLMQRPLIEFILENHVVVSADHTRLALMTFAKDLTLLYDGISYDSDLEKCTLFTPDGPWSQALYNRDPDVSQGTYIDQALNKAFDMVSNSQRQVPKAILVVTDGSWNSDRNPGIEHIMQLIKNSGVEVYSMMSGVYGISQYGNVKDVATAKDHYAEESTWVNVALSVTPAIKWFTPGAPWSCSEDTCCHPVVGNVSESQPVSCRQFRCKNGGLCVDGDGIATCLCRLGFHGNECQHSVDDCLQDACPWDTECEDSNHRYTCTCPNKTEDCLDILKGLCGFIPGKFKKTSSSEGNGKYSNDIGNETGSNWYSGPSTAIHQYHFISINAIVAIVCVCLVLLFLIIGIVSCLCWRRDPNYNTYRKQCLCCAKPPPEVTQTATATSALPGPSVSMDTYPGAVANPVPEANELPPKFGLKGTDMSDVYTRSLSNDGGEASGSSVPTISQTLQNPMGSQPPSYSSLYQGTKPKLNRRESQQPLVPASPDDFGSTSPLADLYPQFDPVSNRNDPLNDDLDLENTNQAFSDLENNNNVISSNQSNHGIDINNFRDLPINADIDYDLAVTSYK